MSWSKTLNNLNKKELLKCHSLLRTFTGLNKLQRISSSALKNTDNKTLRTFCKALRDTLFFQRWFNADDKGYFDWGYLSMLSENEKRRINALIKRRKIQRQKHVDQFTILK